MIKKANKDLVKHYIEKYDKSDEYEHYRVEEKGLNDVFKTFPKNDKLEHILIKAVLLNKFYSTNIMNPRKVADRIFELNIDNALENGDADIIDKIANISFLDKKNNIEKHKRFYSFATKYCHKSKPELYPIYDSNVAYILKAYRKLDNHFQFKNDDLKDYAKFKDIIDDFKNHYNLQNFNYRDLDHFLWIYGKEEQKK